MKFFQKTSGLSVAGVFLNFNKAGTNDNDPARYTPCYQIIPNKSFFNCLSDSKLKDGKRFIGS
jgi:hypothetical protein